ncbi:MULTISPECIES: hypothetical protein [Rhizobium]|uniref:hypothetical protein n=1 Tax=Rhizobium TaxID=379 RepID=UPI0007EA23D9|nr:MULTISPECIES: hypothetical protein [Rhizobium]ANK89224.1 hypothetical protein AMK02_PE00161 [Rhizobium sp. N731]ANK94581.1 hypothetical protein AMK01_PC00165 [Rhizobium sp. N6212]ANL00631.1 hypothetical protein AMK00_PC00165 [Rhizobium sp. N621]ANL06752.1 hypothetical protein AMJ99_PC00165 [Rhizobium esperanzae]ANL12923.1 hypothetical protein AMJ98_PD00165 [Rhizobium sp. N1341]
MSRLTLSVFTALALLLGGLQSTFAASSNSRDETTTMGESGNLPPNDNAGSSNGTKDTSTNKGNPDNTNCNDCGSTGPGNK